MGRPFGAYVLIVNQNLLARFQIENVTAVLPLIISGLSCALSLKETYFLVSLHDTTIEWHGYR